MTETARDYLLALVENHRRDRDSGEGLIDALVRLLGRNRAAGLPAVRDQLLDWAGDEDERLWGTALEALVRDPDPRNAIDLEQLLRLRPGGAEWREQLLLALLRLGHAPALDLFSAYFAGEVHGSRPATLTLLQHLYPLDLENALDWAAQIFSRTLDAGSETGMHIQAHLVALCRIDPRLVVDLVRRTRNRHGPAGLQLGRLFAAELKRPWIRDSVGGEVAAELSRALAAESGRTPDR